MPLIASISGIRGTIGGTPGDGLTPIDVVKFAAAYGTWLKQQAPAAAHPLTVAIGRDARISGPMVRDLVAGTLRGVGLNVVDLGLTTTPTVEMAVPWLHAAGGIILTASHNPGQWNALKLLNSTGEFISAADGEAILRIYQQQSFDFVPVEKLGLYRLGPEMMERHFDAILALPLVDAAAIGKRNFKVVVDAVNSSGGEYVPALLQRLGVTQITELNCEADGRFAHNPEPLAENLSEIMGYIREHKADIGIVVDPDVDRLALITENGDMFGEEYTLVAVADYVLQHTPGACVSNLSSSRALRDVAARYNQPYSAAAVGEVNVVAQMKRTHAVIGGEGNGGIIYPKLHYGRDALVGIALMLSHLARSGQTLSKLRAGYPQYFMAKHKIELQPGLDVDAVLAAVAKHYAQHTIDKTDGVKIDLPDRWIHLRKSNTEPIIRIYTEASTAQHAEALAQEVKGVIKKEAKL
jgi:phosphomannomutase